MIIITVARKPSTKSTTDTALENGCGGFNIDASRVGTENMSAHWDREWQPQKGVMGSRYSQERRERGKQVPDGRWPANLFLSSVAVGRFPYTETHAGTYRKDSDYSGTSYTILRNEGDVASKGNSGSAARYFKVF